MLLRASSVLCVFLLSVVSAAAQPADEPRLSVAVEADVLAYALPGYSGILNVSFANGLQVAFGVGRYDVPGFMLEGDDNHARAEWTATVTSLQVLRATYRFRGPMKSGPALGGVVLSQSWRLRSAPLGGETRFRPISAGVTGGYYVHVGPHFYLYPTAAFTVNRVASGTAAIAGVPYTVERQGPVASLHAGWEWGR